MIWTEASRPTSGGTDPLGLRRFVTTHTFSSVLVVDFPYFSFQQMTWYIGIGDDIKRDQEIRFPFYRTLDENFLPSELIFTDRLYECADP